MTMHRDIPTNVAEGDDVVVVLPITGRQIDGRVTRIVGNSAHVLLDLGDERVYPMRWVYAWEDAPWRIENHA